jgi:hypothetical protein
LASSLACDQMNELERALVGSYHHPIRGRRLTSKLDEMKNMYEGHGRCDAETAYEAAAIYEKPPHALCSSQLTQTLESLATVAAPPSQNVERLPLRENFAWTLASNAIYAASQWAMLVAITKLGAPAMVGQFALGLAVAAPVFMLTNLQLRVVLATDAYNQYRHGHYLAPRMLGTAAGLT